MLHGRRPLHAGLVALLLALPSLAQETLPRWTIGVVADGPWVDASPFRVYEDRILDLVRGEFDVRFPPAFQKSADWTPDTVRAAADQLLGNDEVDIILALGVLASNDLARRESLGKPVIAPFVLNPQLQGIPYENGVSGRNNLTYLALPHNLRRDLEVFRDVAPFGRMALLLSQHVYAAVPGIDDVIEDQSEGMALIIDRVLVGQTASGALASIPAEAEAVYLGPLLNMSDAEVDLLIAGLIERRLPSFSLGGKNLVERGVMASLWPQLDLTRLAQTVALDVQRILLGENPSNMPVTVPEEEQLTINMSTARAIQVFPPWKVLTEAELLNEEDGPVARELSLGAVLREATEVNVALAARTRGRDAGQEEVVAARSRLYPQIRARLQRDFIDSSRPRAGFIRAERQLIGGLEMEQMLYSDDLVSEHEVAGLRQLAREFNYDAASLDTALDAGRAYLDVLTAKTLERLRKENLRRSRDNYEQAEVRMSLGFASPAERHRWDSEIAREQGAVLVAQANRRQAEVALNRILHRPQEETFITSETDLEDPQLGVTDPRLAEFTRDPWIFRVFRDFMVAEGLENAPELRAIDSGISAQNRLVLNAERSTYVPDVYLRANLDHAFDTSGTGANTTQIDDTTWDVTIQASLPIGFGSGRYATRRGARHRLIQLRFERESAAELVEERIRLRLHAVSASHPIIELSEQSAEAARSNLELVQDAYSRGVVSIIEVIDAQNSTLAAEQDAATAIYRFLADMLEVQRAVGRFDHFMTPADRDAWYDRLQHYYETSGLVPIDDVVLETEELQTP